MNRNLTWGDRQAESARVKNLERLRKLAASAPAPEAPATNEEPEGAKPAAKQANPAAKKTQAPAKTSAKKSPAKAAAKKKAKK